MNRMCIQYVHTQDLSHVSLLVSYPKMASVHILPHNHGKSYKITVLCPQQPNPLSHVRNIDGVTDKSIELISTGTVLVKVKAPFGSLRILGSQYFRICG